MTLTSSSPPPGEPSSAAGEGTTRARMLDELAANATVAPVTRLVDGWLCKAAPTLPFRRANAVLPPIGAGADLHAASVAIDAIEAWYGSLGQRTIVQVSAADPSAPELDAHLAGRGYEVEAPVDILVAPTARIAEAGERAADGLRVGLDEAATPGGEAGRAVALSVDAGVDATWAARYADVHGADEVWRARTEAYGRMLATLGPAILGGAATVGAETVGVGFAVLERGWAGIYGMGTAPAWRWRGVGGSLLGALAVAARRAHAVDLYLQVEADNAVAQSTYRGLGFEPSHGYHYRVTRPR